VEPLKNKTADDVVEAFGKILAKTNQRCLRVQSDRGTEFNNFKFKKFLKNHGIAYNPTNNPETKASICERVIRTLKSRIFKYLTHANTFTYIDKLQDFVKAYNNAYHRTIKMAPSDVNDTNILQVYENIKESQRIPKRKYTPKLKVGDYVRISKIKGVFEKGYESNWTREVFKIKSIVRRNPVVYRLVDLNDEEITGTFYEHEVQKVFFDETASRAIEKIIKQRGRGKNLQYLVRWRGYNKYFDSWILASTITSI